MVKAGVSERTLGELQYNKKKTKTIWLHPTQSNMVLGKWYLCGQKNLHDTWMFQESKI